MVSYYLPTPIFTLCLWYQLISTHLEVQVRLPLFSLTSTYPRTSLTLLFSEVGIHLHLVFHTSPVLGLSRALLGEVAWITLACCLMMPRCQDSITYRTFSHLEVVEIGLILVSCYLPFLVFLLSAENSYQIYVLSVGWKMLTPPIQPMSSGI